MRVCECKCQTSDMLVSFATSLLCACRARGVRLSFMCLDTSGTHMLRTVSTYMRCLRAVYVLYTRLYTCHERAIDVTRHFWQVLPWLLPAKSVFGPDRVWIQTPTRNFTGISVYILLGVCVSVCVSVCIFVLCLCRCLCLGLGLCLVWV